MSTGGAYLLLWHVVGFPHTNLANQTNPKHKTWQIKQASQTNQLTKPSKPTKPRPTPKATKHQKPTKPRHHKRKQPENNHQLEAPGALRVLGGGGACTATPQTTHVRLIWRQILLVGWCFQGSSYPLTIGGGNYKKNKTRFDGPFWLWQ